MLFKVLLILLELSIIVCVNSNLVEIIRWRILNYADTPRLSTFQIAGNNYYIDINNIPMGLSVYNQRLFITVPRLQFGIPSTVNVIDLSLRENRNNLSPMLRGYPDYQTNELAQANNLLIADSTRIISVYRSRVDDCARLWFVDTGVVEDAAGNVIVQPPSIWIYDLKTDKLITRFEIPIAFQNSPTGFQSINVDVNKTGCAQAFAYIPNGISNTLLVFSLEQNRAWQFTDPSFINDPAALMISVAGTNILNPINIHSIALGRRNKNGTRTAYYQPFGSFNEFSVTNDVLKSEARSLLISPGDFKLTGSRGINSQAIIHDYDPKTGALFFSEVQLNAITCWDVTKTLIPSNVVSVVQDDGLLEYVSDIKADGTGNIYFMSNRFPLVQNGLLDRNVFNFYIFKRNTRALTTNTICDRTNTLRSDLEDYDYEDLKSLDDLDERDGMISAEFLTISEIKNDIKKHMVIAEVTFGSAEDFDIPKKWIDEPENSGSGHEEIINVPDKKIFISD